MKNLVWCFLFGIFLVRGIFAQPELDTTFAGTGKLIQNGATAYTNDMVMQPDRKIVMVSSCSTATLTFSFCAARFNENGVRDITFGGPALPGFALINTIPGISSPRGVAGVAIQGDGKLVLASFGRVFVNGSPDVRVIMIRLDSNGILDPSFGTGGSVQSDIAPDGDDRAQKVVIQPDGKIVIIGYIEYDDNVFQQFFARYNPDGTLDGSFGDGGVVRTIAPAYSTFGTSIALQTDGKIIGGGVMSALPGAPAPSSHMLTRLNPDGSPDITWDGDGVSNFPGETSPSDGGVGSLAIQSDGRVVALGNVNVLYRFNPDGSPDTGFDGDGSRSALNGNSYAHDLTISAGGRITVVGQPIQTSQLAPLVYRLARYLPDGSPDTGFSGDGFLDINLTASAGQHVATSVAADNQGRIVVSGASVISTVYVFSVVRLLAPIVPVNIAGRVTRSNGNPVSNITVSLGLNGTTIATSRTNPFGYYSFPGVTTGQDYSVLIKARGSTFPRHDVFVADDISNLDFVEGGTSTKAGEIKDPGLELQYDRKSPW